LVFYCKLVEISLIHINLLIIFFRKENIADVLELTFAINEERFGEVVEIELKENGRNIPVTEENKHEYVK
jgi:hypothetical protein